MSKVVEFVDTMFLILRKRPVIFLHWYHHAATCVYVWYLVSVDNAMKTLAMGMNLSVHSIMYTYYALRAASFQVPQYIAIGITMAQILQMILGALGGIFGWLFYIFGPGCDTTNLGSFFSLTIYISYLYLFIQLFKAMYLDKPKRG